MILKKQRRKEAAMATYPVTIFKPYDFTPGQKIRIEGGKRNGDWEVIDVSEAKVKLRCPSPNASSNGPVSATRWRPAKIFGR
jgi:hypothetical protein